MKNLLMALVLMPVMASADTEIVNGIEWRFTISDGTATVSGNDDWAAIPDETVGAIEIPSVLGGCPVADIGYNAFYGCSGLTSVTIPSSVTSIESYAFYGCSGLKDADGVVIVKAVLYGYYGAAWSVTIPDGVTSIGYGAFWSCSSMRSVTIPSSVTSIGNYAFYHCYRLASVTIPSSVTNIGEWAFYHCYGLVSVTISSSVTSIGSDAFNNCSALKVVYAAKGDAERVAKLYQWASSVEFVEIDPPVVEGDEGATVVGDPDAGFVIKLSEGRTAVEVTIPQGVDAAKVTVEVSPKVVSVKPNGAKVKIVSGGADITECLNAPAADGNGVVDLTKATVKEEIVKETMDVEKGAKIVLDAADPKLTTAKTRVGLFYQLREGETLDGMKDGDSKVGDGQPWSPEIKVKGGDSAFYSIGVGKGE